MSWVVHEDMKIEMTKGDTPSFAFQAFLPDGSEYEFEEGFQRKIQSIWNWENISGNCL